MSDRMGDLEAKLQANPEDRELFAKVTEEHEVAGDWRALRVHHERYAAEEADFKRLAEVLEGWAGESEDPEEKAAMLVAVGDIARERLGERDRAMDVYRKAFAGYRADFTALERARRVYREEGDHERVLLLYKLQEKSAKGAEDKGRTLVEMAQVEGDYRGDHEAALRLLEGALEVDPGQPIMGRLEEVYRRGGTFEAHIAERVRAAHEAQAGGDSARASDMFMDGAELAYWQVGADLSEALAWARRGLELDPESSRASEFVSRVEAEVAREAQWRGALVDVVREGAKEPSVEEEGIGGEVEQGERAQVDNEEGEEPGEVARAIERVGRDAGDLDAIAVVIEHLEGRGDWAGLVEVLEKSAKRLRKKQGELDVLLCLGRAHEELGDGERAEYYFKRVRQIDPDHPAVSRFYESYYEASQQWRKLLSLWMRRLDALEDEGEVRSLVERCAALADEKMERPEKAISVWRAYLREHEGDEAARGHLRRLYEDHAKWNSLVDFLKEDVGLLEREDRDTDAERVRLLERVAEIYRDELGLDVMVINTLQQVMEIDPTREDALAELKTKLEQNRRWNDLAELLEARAERAQAEGRVEEAADDLLAVADIWQESLRNVTQALPYLERVVELAPMREGVSERLRGIYESRRDYASLFDLRLRGAAQLEGAARAEELDELAELARDRLNDSERSARVLNALREVRPDDLDVLDKLAFMHRRGEDWRALLEVLEARAGMVDADEALALRRQVAKVYEEHLDDPSATAAAWAKVLELEPKDERALREFTGLKLEAELFDDVEQFYAQRGELAELHATMMARGEQVEGEAAARVLRAAVSAARRLEERPELEARSLEALYEQAEDKALVLARLEELYEAIGDVEAQIGVARRALEEAQTREERLACCARLADLQAMDEAFGEALGWQLRYLGEKPADAEALEKAELWARAADDLAVLVEHLEVIAEGEDDPEGQEVVWSVLARLLRDDYEDHESAAGYFERLRDRRPTDAWLLKTLAEVYEELERPEAQVEMLREHVSLRSSEGVDREELVDELGQIADVQRRYLGEPSAARETYHEILDIDPDHLPALRGMRGLYRDEGRWDDVASSYLREMELIGLEDAGARDALRMELAEVYRERLGDLREAIHLYGQVLSDNPEHEEAIAAVEELLSEDEIAREAALLLEPLFRHHGQVDALARALEARREVASDRFEEQEILDELIGAYAEELGDVERAFELACRQFELDPGREEVWLRVEQLGAGLNRWEEIEGIFASYLAEAEGLYGSEGKLLRHVAAIREHQLQRTEEALSAWERLYEEHPEDDSVLEALERLYRGMQRTEELVEVLEAKAELLDDAAARARAWEEAARLREDVLGDEFGALEAWRGVLEVEPSHVSGARAMERLLEVLERWVDLDDLWTQQADLATEPSVRREYLLKMGRLRWERLNDEIGAAELLGRLVTEDPTDEEALGALEALDAVVGGQDARSSLRLELLNTLEGAYRSRQDDAALAGVLRLKAAGLSERFDKLVALDELIDLFEHRLDDAAEAFSIMAETIALDAGSHARRERYIGLGEQLGCVAEVVETLRDAALDQAGADASGLYVRAGELLEEQLEDRPRAIAAYEQALRVNPDDQVCLEALERLYQVEGDHERLADNLRRQEALAGAGEKAELLARLGSLYEDVLDRPVDAAEAFGELLELEPESGAAFAGLERLYRRLQRWVDLSYVLRRRADSTLDEAERLAALEELAALQEEELQDVIEAVEVYREIIGAEPGNVEASMALERLYRAEARWSEVAEVLRQRLVSVSLEEDARVEVELGLAKVLYEELFEVEGALELYRSVLAQRPGERAAVEAVEALVADETWAPVAEPVLVETYTRFREWEELIGLFDLRCEQVFEQGAKASYQARIGEIARDKLNAREQAMAALARAWRLDPSREDALEAFRALVQIEGAWSRLVEVYEEALVDLVDPEHALKVRLELGRVYRERLEDPFEAERHYRAVLEVDAKSFEAYGALQDIYVKGEQWHELVELFEQRFLAMVDEDVEAAVGLLQHVATLQEEQIDDSFSAVETHERILGLQPEHVESVRALRRLLRAQHRWEDLAELLASQIQVAAEPGVVVELKFALGELLVEALKRPADGLPLFEDILAVEPEHRPSREVLEGMLEGQGELRVDAARVLEPVCRAGQDWGGVVNALRVLAGEDPSRSTGATLEEAARLAEAELADVPLAFEVHRELLMAAPESEAGRMGLLRLGARTGEWDEVVEGFEQVLQQRLDVGDALRAELFVTQAAVLEARLGEIAGATEAYREALLMSPAHPEAVDGLERALARSKDWRGLAEFFTERAEQSVDVEEASGWLTRLATHYEEVEGRVDAAIDVYRQILDMEPDAREASEALESLYAHSGRWSELADLYRVSMDREVDPEVVMRGRLKLARLLEEELDDVEGALTIRRDILAVEPGHAETLRSLEGLRRDLAARDGAWDVSRRGIIELLLEHYNEQQHWRRIVDLLEEKQSLSGDLGGRVAALTDMAEVIQRAATDDDEKIQAVMKLARGVCLEPGNQQLRERVAERAGQLDAWHRVLPVYLRGLESTDEPDQQAELLLAIAGAYDEHLGDTDSAIAAYQLAVDLTESKAALGRLQKLYGAMEAWRPLVEVLQRRLEGEYDAEARGGLLSRIGGIYDDILDMPERAVEAYGELHEDDPGDVAVVETLERLYRRLERWEDLEEVLRSRLRLEEGVGGRVDVLRELAEVQDARLDDRRAAIVTYAEIVELDEEAIDAVRALSRLLTAEERWAELIDNLGLERDFAGGLDELNALDLRMAGILKDKLDSPIEAFERYSQVAARSVADDGALSGMVALLEREETREQASRALRGIWQEREAWDELRGLYERELEHVDEPDRLAELFMELAQLHEERFENRQMAFMTLGRAMRQVPDVVYLRRELERLGRSLGSLDELAAVYEDTLETVELEPLTALELRKRLGELYADELGAVDEAIEHLQQALQLDEFDVGTLDLLDRLYQQQHRWEELAGVLQSRLMAASPEEINDVRFRLGYLHEVMFEERAEAFEHYRQVILDDSGHGGAIEGLARMLQGSDRRAQICELLEPVYREMGAWANVARVLELKLEALEHDADRVEVSRRLASVYLDELGDVHAGYAQLGRALRADPHAVDVQERLEEIGDAQELHEPLVALYEDIIEGLDDPVRLVELAERAGQWSLSILDDSARAAELYQVVLDIEPERASALHALEAIARMDQDLVGLERILARKVDAAYDPDERWDGLMELGRVRVQLEQFDLAIDALEEALLLDDSDVALMRELVGVYEVTERYDELVRVLNRLALVEDDFAARKELYMRVGVYHRAFLGRPHEAVEAYLRVLDIEPGEAAAVKALEELYAETEQWQKLQAIVERQLENPEGLDEAELVRLYVQRAKVSYHQFGQAESAIEDYQRAFELTPDSPLVVSELDALYRSEGRWDELAGLYRQQMQVASDEDRLIELHLEMAEIQHVHLEEDDEALELLDIVVDLRPENLRALDLKKKIFEGQGDWPNVVRVLERRILAVPDQKETVDMLLEIAQIGSDELQNATVTVEAYLQVLDVAPDHERALSSLEEIYEHNGLWGELYAICEHRVALAEEDEVRAALFMRMAELAGEQLASEALRIESLELAYGAVGMDLDVVEPLLDAYIEAGRHEDAEPLLETVVSELRQARRMKEVVRFEHLRGKLAEVRGDVEGARQAYLATHKIDASYIPNLLSLGKIEVGLGDWEAALKTFQTLLLHQMSIEDAADKVQLYYYLGVVRVNLGDVRRARDMFNRALGIDADHSPSREALAGL